MKPLLAGLFAITFFLASCKTLDDHYPDVARPVPPATLAGAMIVHERSAHYGENWMATAELDPYPQASPAADPHQVTIETNVVLLKQGTIMRVAPYELLVEGRLEGQATTGDYALLFQYSDLVDLQGTTAPVKLPWEGGLSRISWNDLNNEAEIPVVVQEGKIGEKWFRLSLTRGLPFHEDPFARWTFGLLVAPLAELLLFLDPPVPNSVYLQDGFVSSLQRFQLTGEDGVVWGELEGETYRVFASPTAPQTEDVIRILAMVRLEVWMFKNLTTSKPPNTRNVRYLAKVSP